MGSGKKRPVLRIAIVTSIHPDFDSRVWKHATSVAKAGYEVKLVCPWDLPSGTKREGVVFHTFERVQERWKRVFSIPRRVFRILRQLYPEIDIIHFHDIDLLPWMAVAARKRCVVYDVHENYPDEMLVRPWVPGPLRRPAYFFTRAAQRWLANQVRNLVFVVPSQDEDFDLVNCRRIFMYNFATLDLLNSAKDDYLKRRPIVLFTGAQNELTGTWPLVQAAKIVCERNPEAEFHLSDRFTVRAFRERVVAQIAAWGMEERIKLIPPVPSDQMPQLLNRARVGVVPSERLPQQAKGIPRKLFEYMAMGLPLVLSDLPFLKLLIEENNCGVLARPEDPETFATAILALLDNPERAKELGRLGQKAFESKFCWESQIPGLLEFYELIAADAAHTGRLNPA